MKRKFLYIGTMQQASRWAIRNGVPTWAVIPGSRGMSLWRGQIDQPVIVDENAPMVPADLSRCLEALDFLSGLEMMYGKPKRYWDEMDDLARKQYIMEVKDRGQRS